jgi:hydroxymethylpyrimidine pyrophosphatase-like HAD family hydrolase
MRYMALATDYDGTLAADGLVAEEAWQAVKRLRDSGRKVILVTGRELEELQSICPNLEWFDRVVAENGGLLYRPATREQKILGPPPPKEFIQALHDRGLTQLGIGKTIVATFKPHETVVIQAIRDLGLELQVIFNKDAVMILPPGVNKATGLQAALEELDLSPHNVVAVGDAENDHAFLALCECSAAVANALPTLKGRADIVLHGDHGHGVIELIDQLLAGDLARRDDESKRHRILLGRRKDGEEVHLPAYGAMVLVAGPSGSGKSTVTTGLMERLAAAGYQFCVVDPEGDYDNIKEAIVLGDTEHTPSVDEVQKLLRQAKQNVVVNMLRVPMGDRALFCASLLLRLQELRAQTGRPHWLIFDEAHHVFPAEWEGAAVSLPQQLETALLITVHPEHVSPEVLQHVNTVVAVGNEPVQTLSEFAAVVGRAPPRSADTELAHGEVLIWQPGQDRQPPFVVEVEPGHTERRRHSRKYAEGLLVPERSFYFRGPEEKLNLRAHNLILFMEMAEGVDDATWLHHFRQGDFSRWFREGIGDKSLASEAEEIESHRDLSAAEGRERIRAAIERHYTLSDNPSVPRLGPPVNS